MAEKYTLNAQQLLDRGRNGLEPARTNLFMIEFSGLPPTVDQSALQFGIRNISGGEQSLQELEIPYLAHKIKVPLGSDGVSELSMEFMDFADIPVRTALENWFAWTFEPSTGFMNVPSLSKCDIRVIALSGQGRPIYSYLARGCWPRARPPMPSFDMGSPDVARMNMSIIVDFIDYEQSAFTLGAAGQFAVPAIARGLGALR